MKPSTKYIDSVFEMSSVFFTRGENGEYNIHLGDITTAQVLSELNSESQIEVLNISLNQPDELSSGFTIAYEIKNYNELLEYLLYLYEHPKIILIDFEANIGDIYLFSHDDGEVSLSLKTINQTDIMQSLLNRFGYQELPLSFIIDNPNKYIKLKKPGLVDGIFEDFMDLVNSYN